MKESIEKKTASPRRRRLGEILVDVGLIDEKTLATALEIQAAQNKKLGQVLIDMGVADDVEIAKALAQQLKIPLLRLDDSQISPEVVARVPAEIAESYLLMPVRETGGKLVVAMVDPLEFYAVDDLRFVTQMPISVAVAPRRDIIAALERHYPSGSIDMALKDTPGLDGAIEIVQSVDPDEKDENELLKVAQLPPVVRFANAILADAIKLNASDIHIEPQKSTVIVRYRIDGIMREVMSTDKHVHTSLISRLKIISGMDISIRRKPQDGRAQVRVGDRQFDLRVSSIPTSFGEKITIRILNPDRARIEIEDLNLSHEVLERFKAAIRRPQGILLVTGLTGSGKSSTLYACLNRLNTPEVNIITVEDPIEYELGGINQVQINTKAGITFAAGLRSILRQDPDIVMVGEIRDGETAGIAFQAAQTGHLVLSTLHTNDAPSAVVRLLDLGVDDFLISSALVAVMGQRLVRKICSHCKVPDPVSPQMLRQIFPYVGHEEGMKFWKGAGCETCQYSGYAGRMGLFEFFEISPAVRALVSPRVSDRALRQAAEGEGFRPLTTDGIAKALAGMTTIEEVFRVAPPEVEAPGDKAEAPAAAAVTIDAPGPVPEPEPIAAVVGAKPKRVLVADDSEIILKVVRNILENGNYLVETAANGLEALKLAHRERPDLIITDCLMPEMDGIALIQKLRSHLTTRYIPIIMLTAKNEVDDEVKGIDAGADDYITKPVNPERLLARAKRLIHRADNLT